MHNTGVMYFVADTIGDGKTIVFYRSTDFGNTVQSIIVYKFSIPVHVIDMFFL